jgi:HSP20 family protein
MNQRPSFFRKLLNALHMNSSSDEEYYDEEEITEDDYLADAHISGDGTEEEIAGELAVDVYELRDVYHIVSVTAGVRKGDFDISLTREVITITGTRTYSPRMDEDSYLTQELYWGTFTRTIALPEEVDIEKAEAKEEMGLLTIKLPKVDPNKKTRLKVL